MSNKNLRFKRTKLELSAKEKKAVDELTRPTALIIYETISVQGRHEMERPFSSLMFSGIVAGFALSLSVLGKALFDQILPDSLATKELWKHFGYSFGFIVVIMGRMQLFTENTITPILPLLTSYHFSNLVKTLRLWGIVLLANVFGTGIMAVAVLYFGILSTPQIEAIIHISEELLPFGFWEALTRSMPAGFLIAAVVWLLPAMIATEFWIIILLTFLMSLGAFPHIIVGSLEALILIFSGTSTPIHMLFYFYLPVLFGNIIGGTGLFALLAYAQVREEISSK